MTAPAAARAAGARRTAPRTSDGRRVVLAAGVLVLAATGFRAWQLHGAWFFYDDLYFIQRALESPLDASYLFEPYNGHLMPGGHLLSWVNARISAQDFRWPAAEILLGFTIFGAASARLYVSLFGRRWAALVPLTLTLFAPFLIPATIWWAAAVNQIPMMIAIVLALTSWVDYLRDPRPRPLVATLAWIALGLVFVERTLIGLPILWLVALLYFTEGSLPERFRMLWDTYRTAALVQVGVVAAYVVAYVSWAMNFDAGAVTDRPLFGVLHDLVGVAFASGTVGGPLDWKVSQVTQSEAHPSQLMLLGAWAVIATLVVTSAVTRRRGLRAWLIPATILLANAMLIAVSRAIYFGDRISLDFRFQTESALTWSLAVGLAFWPVVGARESSEPRPDAPWTPSTPAWVIGGCVGFVVLAVVSTAAYPLRNLTTTSPRDYYATLDASVAEHPGVPLLNLQTPKWLWAPLAFPTNTYRHMFRMVDHDLRIADTVTDTAWMVDDTGRLREVDLDVAREQSAKPDDDGCFGSAEPGRTTWELDGPVIGPGWFLRLQYDAEEATTAEVTVDEEVSEVDLEAGAHTLLVPASAVNGYDSVTVELPDDSSPVCLQGLQVGLVTPAD